MRAYGLRIGLMVLLVLGGGCKSKPRSAGFVGGLGDSFASAAAPMQTRALAGAEQRMLIWRASLSLEVGSISRVATQAVSLVRDAGGYVEREWSSDDTAISLTLRVPMAAFSNTVAGLERLGSVQSRNVSSDDVTAEYVDTDARLKNMIALRDRLRDLLLKATEVKDLLSALGSALGGTGVRSI